MYIKIPLVRARGGAEVALGSYYKAFLIYRTCMRRTPARPRARASCEAVAVLLCKNMTSVRPRRNATKSGHFLHTSHCALHTSRFTLHTCTSHSTLHLISNHVSSSHIISPHLSSSHLAPSLLTCHLSKFFLNVFISSGHWPTFLISPKFFSTHLSSSARARKLVLSERNLLNKKNIGRRKLLHKEAWDTGAFTQKSLSNILVRQSLHKALPSTTLYTLYFPVRLCTTKLAESTPQYYFVLQSLHMSTDHDKKHAAITLRSAAKDSASAGIYAQPLINCRTQRRNRLPIVTIGPETAARTSCPSSLAASTLHWKHKVSFSGFLPNASPMQHPRNHTRITRMHFAAPGCNPACIYAHGNKTCQQSCSYYNWICNHRFQNTLALRTHDEPSTAKHHQGTNHAPKQTDCTPRTRGTFHRRPKRLYTEKHFVLRHPPQTKAPCNIHTAITMCFAATRTHPCSHCNAI